MVLAGLENTKYWKYEAQIEPGDKIFLYTDGVVEATNMQNEQYGERRLREFLNQNVSLDVTNTIHALKKDINEFVGKAEQFDDITMLELFYKKRKDDNSRIVSKSFKAIESELPHVQDYVEKELLKYGIDLKTMNQIHLVVEEIFVNIASYAYPNKDGECTLKIENIEDGNFAFTFEDEGIRFNPLEQKDPDITLGAEEREIGGLGIFITKKTMDDVKYTYENGKNILSMTKKIK